MTENNQNNSPLNILSKREKEVMELLVICGCVKSVALQIHLSPRTVEMYVNKIKDKLNLMYKHQFNQLVIQYMYDRNNHRV